MILAAFEFGARFKKRFKISQSSIILMGKPSTSLEHFKRLSTWPGLKEKNYMSSLDIGDRENSSPSKYDGWRKTFFQKKVFVKQWVYDAVHSSYDADHSVQLHHDEVRYFFSRCLHLVWLKNSHLKKLTQLIGWLGIKFHISACPQVVNIILIRKWVMPSVSLSVVSS